MLSKKVKRAEPEIGKAPLFSSARLRYVFFIRLSLSGRSPALPVTFRRMKWLNMSFPISGAKVLLLFDICKFFGKKMQLHPLFRKTTNKKSDPPQSGSPFFYMLAARAITHRMQSGTSERRTAPHRLSDVCSQLQKSSR